VAPGGTDSGLCTRGAWGVSVAGTGL